ncbi:MAG: hypothetical protein PVI90_19635 [Desulfobacteraceae bacterium]|jgi:hypothetical protein
MEIEALNKIVITAEKILLEAREKKKGSGKTEDYIIVTALLQTLDKLTEQNEKLEDALLEQTSFIDINSECDAFWRRCSLSDVNPYRELFLLKYK